MRPKAQYETTMSDGRVYVYQLDEHGKVINFRAKDDDSGEPSGSKNNPITG